MGQVQKRVSQMAYFCLKWGQCLVTPARAPPRKRRVSHDCFLFELVLFFNKVEGIFIESVKAALSTNNPQFSDSI